MKKQLLFIHSAGAQGSGEGSNDLVAFLRRSSADVFDVFAPSMPDPENPHYSAWKQRLAREMEKVESGVVLVGHSLGGSVLLKYLSEEKIEKTVGGLFLISTPYWGNKSWTVSEFMLKENFASTLPMIPEVILYHSHDDEWVPFEHVRQYAKKLPDATVRALDGRGHFINVKNFSELKNDILSLTLEKSKQQKDNKSV
jgi:predicted alpha/beta hydrolase family esterase